MILGSKRVVTAEGVRPAALVIENGIITHVRDYVPRGCDVDYGDFALLPGVVDPHVHINEPGRTQWEGFTTATRAAAAGGVTTLIDMPLNSIPATIDAAALRAKVEVARDRCHVDVGFWGGLVPGNVGALGDLLEHGVFGFKCFMVDSGVPEFAPMQADELRRAAPVLAQLDTLLLVHAEWPSVIDEAAMSDHVALGDPRTYDSYLQSRPAEAETEAVSFLIDLVRESGCRVHIVHLAAPAALPLLQAARAHALPITVETCPHYLMFAAEDVPDGATAYKCAPPIRSRADREQLWQGLTHGVIDYIASDHSPCPPVMKQLESGDFRVAWGGIASLQLELRAVWTSAAERGFGLLDVARWLAETPARVAGLSGRKGAIAPGCDADVVVFDPDVYATVEAELLEHRHKLTPYHGMKLRGVVHATYLRGKQIYGAGEFAEPAGRLLRGAARRARGAG